MYRNLMDFNKKELCAGLAESVDKQEDKKGEQSIFVKIFKMILSLTMLFGLVNYVLFGPEGFKMPKYQNMQSASVKK